MLRLMPKATFSRYIVREFLVWMVLLAKGLE